MNETELLNDVAAKVSAMYQSALEEDVPVSPEIFGQRVADMLAEDWGGINVYIPKGKDRNRQRRNTLIYDEYTTKQIPLSELARKYSLSEQRIYVILATERERRQKRQHVFPGLFP